MDPETGDEGYVPANFVARVNTLESNEYDYLILTLCSLPQPMKDSEAAYSKLLRLPELQAIQFTTKGISISGILLK